MTGFSRLRNRLAFPAILDGVDAHWAPPSMRPDYGTNWLPGQLRNEANSVVLSLFSARYREITERTSLVLAGNGFVFSFCLASRRSHRSHEV